MPQRFQVKLCIVLQKLQNAFNQGLISVQVLIKNLAHSFDKDTIPLQQRHFLFQGLSCALTPGNVYGLIGPSGSGKSTLLSLLAGWVEPTVGEVELVDIEKIGWVFQNPHGVSNRSALDHVILPLLAKGLDRAVAEQLAYNYLSSFNLLDVALSSFKELSGGEAQRLMLARGIAAEPSLLLVDEPTAQLDLSTSRQVSDVLSNIASANTIVVIATHDEHTKNACNFVIDLARFQGQLQEQVQEQTQVLEQSQTQVLNQVDQVEQREQVQGVQ
jgi:ABC-type lipoprotein export system ATPase subunit